MVGRWVGVVGRWVGVVVSCEVGGCGREGEGGREAGVVGREVVCGMW